MRRTALIAAIALVTSLVASGCSTEPSQEETPAAVATAEVDGEILAAHGLADLDVRDVIGVLDTMPLADRPTDLVASIRPNELLLSDAEGREQSVPMPDDEFYVSFAPYISQTHPCHFHSLTTCTGELRNEEIRVVVEDNGTREMILDETVTTFDNGFYGVWLPRHLEGTMTVEHEGRIAATEISTFGDEDRTCVTTLELLGGDGLG